MTEDWSLKGKRFSLRLPEHITDDDNCDEMIEETATGYDDWFQRYYDEEDIETLRNKLIDAFTSDDMYHFFRSIIASYGEHLNGIQDNPKDYEQQYAELKDDLRYGVETVINRLFGIKK